MRRRKLSSWEGCPEDLRPIPVSELDDADIDEDITDEELDAMFKPMCVEDIVYNGKMSIQHPIDIGGKK